MAVAEKAKRSEKRKRKPKLISVINDGCTGCGGSPYVRKTVLLKTAWSKW